MAKVSVEQALAKAKSHIKKGETAEAQALYVTILNAFPNNKKAQKGQAALAKANQSGATQRPPQEAINQLASLFNQGQLAVVVQQAEALTKRHPNNFVIWSFLGGAHQGLGQAAEAAKAFIRVTELNPHYPEGHNNLGVVLQKLGKLEASVKSFQKALSLKPDYPEAYYNMGIALREQGKLNFAIIAHQKSLALDPTNWEAYGNMGLAFKDNGDWTEAVTAYEKALAINPNDAELLYNMGNALQEQGKLQEAIEAYHKALAIKPDYAELLYNMGNALKDQGKLEEAIEAYNKALVIKPDYAEAHSNMGVTLQYQGKLEEAIEAYQKALAIKPDFAEASHNMSFPLLNSGRLKEGLEKYECRWKTIKTSEKKRKFSKPMWDGKEILKGKKVLLWCEQGVGDTINWSSRLPLIESLAERCTLECPTKLVPLMARSFPNIEVKPEDRNNDEQRNDFDYHLPLGSLYRLFLPEILKESKPDAFLLPFPARIKFWTKRLRSLGQGLYVGVSWKSANMSPQRLPNYAPLADWSPIFTIPGVTFINLQYTDFTDDLIEIQNKFGVTVHNFDDLNHFDDLDDVAALCAALDIVVSTKITVPLISAGVGTATKLANWRQSSWNNILLNPVGPSIDIFERNTLEPWHKVFTAIADDIIRLQAKNLGTTRGF